MPPVAGSRSAAPAPDKDRALPEARVLKGVALMVVSGTQHVCSLLGDRTVSCWGKNAMGQLAGGKLDTGSERWSRPVHRALAGAVDLAAHADRTCAVTEAGTVECWGNLRGHAFDAERPAGCDACACASAVPARAAGVSGARAVAVGAEHACALLQTGHVVCWGDNRFGQLGLGHTRAVASHEARTVVVGLHDVAELRAGDYASCARDRRGAVFCWGANAEGQLGAPARGTCGTSGASCSSWALQVQGLPAVGELSVAQRHACARTTSGRLFCWGANDVKQLGVLGPDTCTRGHYDSCAVAPAPGVAAARARKIACGVTVLEVPLPLPARMAVADAAATCAFFEDQTFSCWSEAPARYGSWLKTQSLGGVWDGLAGKPWQVQAVAGENFGSLGAVLFNRGNLQVFSGKSFAPLVISDSPNLTSAQALALQPAAEPHCARAAKPIPSCAGKRPATSDVFTYDAALVGRSIHLRAELGQRASQWTAGGDMVWEPVLLDRNGNPLAFELAHGQRFDCNGGCCDFDGLRAKVLASGVVRSADTSGGNQYFLEQTRLCRLPN
jgi:hypothetical protein